MKDHADTTYDQTPVENAVKQPECKVCFNHR